MFSDKYPMMEQNINLICKFIKILTLLYQQVKTQVAIKVHYSLQYYSECSIRGTGYGLWFFQEFMRRGNNQRVQQAYRFYLHTLGVF